LDPTNALNIQSFIHITRRFSMPRKPSEIESTEEIQFIRRTFNEDVWNLYLVDDNDEVIADPDAAAETDFPKKEIHFRRGDLDEEVVAHELWHVYINYCYLAHTSISVEDLEEVSAALFADKGERIIQRAKEVHKALKELRDG
jgi:hypothetical protein